MSQRESRKVMCCCQHCKRNNTATVVHSQSWLTDSGAERTASNEADREKEKLEFLTVFVFYNCSACWFCSEQLL